MKPPFKLTKEQFKKQKKKVESLFREGNEYIRQIAKGDDKTHDYIEAIKI